MSATRTPDSHDLVVSATRALDNASKILSTHTVPAADDADRSIMVASVYATLAVAAAVDDLRRLGLPVERVR